MSFYDQRVASLERWRREEGVEERKEKQRLIGITREEGEEVKERVRRAVRRKNEEGWTSVRGGVD